MVCVIGHAIERPLWGALWWCVCVGLGSALAEERETHGGDQRHARIMFDLIGVFAGCGLARSFGGLLTYREQDFVGEGAEFLAGELVGHWCDLRC